MEDVSADPTAEGGSSGGDSSREGSSREGTRDGMDWRIKVRKGAATDDQEAEACGQYVGAWRADIMVEKTAGDWEGHEWLRKKWLKPWSPPS